MWNKNINLKFCKHFRFIVMNSVKYAWTRFQRFNNYTDLLSRTVNYKSVSRILDVYIMALNHNLRDVYNIIRKLLLCGGAWEIALNCCSFSVSSLRLLTWVTAPFYQLFNINWSSINVNHFVFWFCINVNHFVFCFCFILVLFYDF